MDRALLVGINRYPGAPLRGCVNDISDMAEHLVDSCGFAKSDIRLLCDERATTGEILARLNWLVDEARPGDRLFFHYSGHGAQLATRDHNGEIDGLDEVICPVDFDWSDAHTIRDKDFQRIFSVVPPGCEFVWVSDSCHSGDLLKDIPPPDMAWKAFPTPPDIRWRIATALCARPIARGKAGSRAQVGNLALISGCRPEQTSADAVFNGRPNGALTYYLLAALKSPGAADLRLDALLKDVQARLAATNKYEQIPNVEGSPDVINRPFLTKP